MAVASQYGIHSLQQTVGSVKFAVWKLFYRDCSYLVCACFVLLLYCIFVCMLCVLCLHSVSTFWCNKYIIIEKVDGIER